MNEFEFSYKTLVSNLGGKLTLLLFIYLLLYFVWSIGSLSGEGGVGGDINIPAIVGIGLLATIVILFLTNAGWKRMIKMMV